MRKYQQISKSDTLDFWAFCCLFWVFLAWAESPKREKQLPTRKNLCSGLMRPRGHPHHTSLVRSDQIYLNICKCMKNWNFWFFSLVTFSFVEGWRQMFRSTRCVPVTRKTLLCTNLTECCITPFVSLHQLNKLHKCVLYILYNYI